MVGTIEVPCSSLTDGTKTVASAGTPERLVASSSFTRGAVIGALLANTSTVYVGDATPAAELDPGDVIILPIDDPYKVYVDVTVNGEGVWYVLVS